MTNYIKNHIPKDKIFKEILKKWRPEVLLEPYGASKRSNGTETSLVYAYKKGIDIISSFSDFKEIYGLEKIPNWKNNYHRHLIIPGHCEDINWIDTIPLKYVNKKFLSYIDPTGKSRLLFAEILKEIKDFMNLTKNWIILVHFIFKPARSPKAKSTEEIYKDPISIKYSSPQEEYNEILKYFRNFSFQETGSRFLKATDLAHIQGNGFRQAGIFVIYPRTQDKTFDWIKDIIQDSTRIPFKSKVYSYNETNYPEHFKREICLYCNERPRKEGIMTCGEGNCPALCAWHKDEVEEQLKNGKFMIQQKLC